MQKKRLLAMLLLGGKAQYDILYKIHPSDILSSQNAFLDEDQAKLNLKAKANKTENGRS